MVEDCASQETSHPLSVLLGREDARGVVLTSPPVSSSSAHAEPSILDASEGLVRLPFGPFLGAASACMPEREPGRPHLLKRQLDAPCPSGWRLVT